MYTYDQFAPDTASTNVYRNANRKPTIGHNRIPRKTGAFLILALLAAGTGLAATKVTSGRDKNPDLIEQYSKFESRPQTGFELEAENIVAIQVKARKDMVVARKAVLLMQVKRSNGEDAVDLIESPIIFRQKRADGNVHTALVGMNRFTGEMEAVDAATIDGQSVVYVAPSGEPDEQLRSLTLRYGQNGDKDFMYLTTAIDGKDRLVADAGIGTGLAGYKTIASFLAAEPDLMPATLSLAA